MKNVIELFLKYVSFPTMSCENSKTTPSTDKQITFAKQLVEDMKSCGLENVQMDAYGYVYGWLPASKGLEEKDCIGLIAHMDTSDGAKDNPIHPKIVRYIGGDLELSKGIVTDAKTYPMLQKYIGQDLIVTDGKTLLGADDKAGIAEILATCAYLNENTSIQHARIAVAFTPDEEIGRGSDFFDIEKFGAKKAYTIDGGELGDIEYENFNAASCKVTVKGVNVHPGCAKNIMKNAILMANDFVSKLPINETPAHTEGYEGFFHVNEMCGDETKATISLIIRDHDKLKFEKRKLFIRKLVKQLNLTYGNGTFQVSIKDSYYNMKEKILPHMDMIEKVVKAMEDNDVEPIIVPIRGGTDGARLSYEGLPCPNLCTGGANFHGVHEFIPVRSMEKMVDVLVDILKM